MNPAVERIEKLIDGCEQRIHLNEEAIAKLEKEIEERKANIKKDTEQRDGFQEILDTYLPQGKTD